MALEVQAMPNERIKVRHARVMLSMASVLSAAAIIVAAFASRPGLATVASAGFILAAILASRVASSRPTLLRDHALLATIAYAWGAISMQGAYLTPLTGLRWQHGWQYALAMALLAAASLAFARMRGPHSENQPHATAWPLLATLLAIVQALVAAGGIAALAVSGKLWSERADWAANRVFAGLAVAILVISASHLIAGQRSKRS